MFILTRLRPCAPTNLVFACFHQWVQTFGECGWVGTCAVPLLVDSMCVFKKVAGRSVSVGGLVIYCTPAGCTKVIVCVCVCV